MSFIKSVIECSLTELVYISRWKLLFNLFNKNYTMDMNSLFAQMLSIVQGVCKATTYVFLAESMVLEAFDASLFEKKLSINL